MTYVCWDSTAIHEVTLQMLKKNHADSTDIHVVTLQMGKQIKQIVDIYEVSLQMYKQLIIQYMFIQYNFVYPILTMFV